MRNDIVITEVGQQYAAAHAAHYGTQDLPEALMLYKALLAAHPDTHEAGYSRSQIQNIVKAVVPQQMFSDAQVDVVTAHLAHGDRPDAPRVPVAFPAQRGAPEPSSSRPPRQADVAEVPGHAHAKGYGVGWQCDWGYRTADQSCEAITVPVYAHLDSFGGRWDCDRGYRDVNEGCVPVEVPPHAFLNSSGHGWQCDRGYQRNDESCVAIVVPADAYLRSSGDGWDCERGFRRSGTSCVVLVVPTNAHIGYSGNAWTCHPGYRQRGDTCLPDEQ